MRQTTCLRPPVVRCGTLLLSRPVVLQIVRWVDDGGVETWPPSLATGILNRRQAFIASAKACLNKSKRRIGLRVWVLAHPGVVSQLGESDVVVILPEGMLMTERWEAPGLCWRVSPNAFDLSRDQALRPMYMPGSVGRACLDPLASPLAAGGGLAGSLAGIRGDSLVARCNIGGGDSAGRGADLGQGGRLPHTRDGELADPRGRRLDQRPRGTADGGRLGRT